MFGPARIRQAHAHAPMAHALHAHNASRQGHWVRPLHWLAATASRARSLVLWRRAPCTMYHAARASHHLAPCPCHMVVARARAVSILVLLVLPLLYCCTAVPQGIKFYDPEIVGDTPETVEYYGLSNLVEAVADTVGKEGGCGRGRGGVCVKGQGGRRHGTGRAARKRGGGGLVCVAGLAAGRGVVCVQMVLRGSGMPRRT